MKTISLKGKTYAPVSARVEQFHSDHEKGSIKTATKFDSGHVIVKAVVTFDDRTFTGHAYGKVQGEKAFEKLETTAVGRALAFAGYLAGGEIASYDEIKEYEESTEDVPENPSTGNSEPNMTCEEACHKLKVVTSIENLKKVWSSLPSEMKKDAEVEAMKNQRKQELSK